MTSLEECKAMWTTDAIHYLLMVPDPNAELSIENAAIVDQRDGALECIEEDDIYLEVKRRMEEAGVRIVRLKDFRHLFKRSTA